MSGADMQPAPPRATTGDADVAYLINLYPKVSHTFIRREIAGLERLGVRVLRIALRGWNDVVTDAEDVVERGRTRYVLQGGLAGLAAEGFARLVRDPARGWAGLRCAWRLSRKSEQTFVWHLAYLAEACRVANWCERAGVRHLHAHFGTNSAAVALLANVVGGPSYSFTVHGPEEFDKPNALHLADKIARAAFVVAISSYGRSQLWRWIPQTQWPRVAVVHCGLEDAFFAAPSSLEPSGARSLVCVGRLCEQKGQLLLIEALAVLKQRGVDLELVLAGDGDMRGVIEQRVARLDVADRVRITGWIDSTRVRQEILAARALVLPSFAEGLPVVIMEAMAVGRPVISTYVAGIPELVRDGVDGWLVPAGDVQALAQAMQQCLEASPEQLAAMGRSAHERVGQRHRVDVEAAKMKALIDGLPGSTS